MKKKKVVNKLEWLEVKLRHHDRAIANLGNGNIKRAAWIRAIEERVAALEAELKGAYALMDRMRTRSAKNRLACGICAVNAQLPIKASKEKE